ncbi:hypothetical protein CQA57_07945 [Helicobacter anseris]|uniref:BspA family leucine-rich repeat surface protein n=1 Tax=Helicobacter anseris TaxID=375926 RepID=A0A3D8J0S2_9HELI|nr:BspA family leucine-rich repeat surface protein [Helicobacter anseris]RDU71088.1 hypothetical protein CQA57_07945 [Helicobacter anseris]
MNLKSLNKPQKFLLGLFLLGMGGITYLAYQNHILKKNGKFLPKNREQLLRLVKNEYIRLNMIDTSEITDMSNLFHVPITELSTIPLPDEDIRKNREQSAWDRQDFTGIETWDTSKVTNMSRMFQNSHFNQPIENWDVSNVKDMSSMFCDAKRFNQPLDKWDVSNVESMYSMFKNAISFNQPLNNWNVSKVKNMSSMFEAAISFNQPLNNWNVGNVNVNWMFDDAISFNQNLDSWGDKNPFKKNHGKNPDYNP